MRWQRLGLCGATVKQGIEMHTVGFVKTTEFTGDAVYIFGRVTSDQYLVERLHGKAARAGAGGAGTGAAHIRRFAVFSGRCSVFAHVSVFINKAISTATRAASRPLSC